MHAFLVVIFNKRFREVTTLVSLAAISVPTGTALRLFIWDNSGPEFKQDNEESLSAYTRKFATVEYFRSPDNASLSALYNKVLNNLFGSGCTAASVLDHDSELAPDFLFEVDKVMAGPLLVVPKVVSNRTASVVSPRYQGSHYYSIRPPMPRFVDRAISGQLPARDFFAVGSGMTIPKSLWDEGLRFDETLTFYGIDTEFCRDYSTMHDSFALANSVLLHDVSSEGQQSLASMIWRFNSHMDYWVIQLRKHGGLPRFVAEFYVNCWRRLVMAKFTLKRLLSK